MQKRNQIRRLQCTALCCFLIGVTYLVAFRGPTPPVPLNPLPFLSPTPPSDPPKTPPKLIPSPPKETAPPPKSPPVPVPVPVETPKAPPVTPTDKVPPQSIGFDSVCETLKDEYQEPKIKERTFNHTKVTKYDNKTLVEYCAPFIYARLWVGTVNLDTDDGTPECQPEAPVRGKKCNWYHMCTWNPAEDVFVSRVIGEGELWESALVAQMIDHIKKSKQPGIVIDAGSNIGQYALIAASLGQVVYGFEPIPHHVDMILKSFMLNGWQDRIHLFQNGLSDYYSTTHIRFHKTNKGGATLAIINQESAGPPDPRFAENIPLDTIRLDDIVPHIQSRYPNHTISYWKADIEGFESRMFRGAQKFLKTFSPKDIAFELLGKTFAWTKCHADRLLHSFLNIGYELIDSTNAVKIDGNDIRKSWLEQRTVSLDIWAYKLTEEPKP